MFQRNTYIDKFKEILLTSEKQYIVLVGDYGVGKTHLLNTLKEDGTLSDSETLFLDPFDTELQEKLWVKEESISTIILDSEHWVDIDYIRTFIESYQTDCRVIFTAEQKIDDERVEDFLLPFVSFREYSETMGAPINMGEIMNGAADIHAVNTAKDEYIHLGHLPRHIGNPETISSDFFEICTDMKSEMYDKEYEQFIEFFRALAMETGNCFKADKLAKLLGITRRKVNKYMEILLKKNVIKPVGAWVQDMETETSRHVKIYFSDLSIYRSLLSDMYYQGAMKMGAIENFIYLEIERKLHDSHDIYYYRKKSGSEVTFILEDKMTKKVTPIEVVSRDSSAISQAMKSFDSEYHDRVERYMIMNESLTERKELSWIPVFILPHAAI